MRKYVMEEGISIVNELTGQIGIAIEYSYSSMFAYRYLKECDIVLVKINDRDFEYWELINCIPAKERKHEKESEFR